MNQEKIMKPKRSHKALTKEQKLRRILDKIDDVLMVGYDDPDKEVAALLWDVLSALRGPDTNETSVIKHATTAVLRKVAFPKTFDPSTISLVRKQRAIGENDNTNKAELRKEGIDEITGTHFEQHAQQGFRALGLGWYSENE
jgi:hypothetical protein